MTKSNDTPSHILENKQHFISKCYKLTVKYSL